MTTPQQLREIAARTGLDAIADLLRDAAGAIETRDREIDHLRAALASAAQGDVGSSALEGLGCVMWSSEHRVDAAGRTYIVNHWVAPAPAHDHGPQAETLEEAARDVAKWLGERPNRPLDLRHVAMLCAHAQAAPAAVAGPSEAVDELIDYAMQPARERELDVLSREIYRAAYRAAKEGGAA